MAAVGVRLRQLIDALNMSYVEAADIMGIDKSGLGNWMRGRPSYPSVYSLYKFCRTKGVDFNWVFLGDPSGLPDRAARTLLGLEPKQADQPEPATQAAGTRKRKTTSANAPR